MRRARSCILIAASLAACSPSLDAGPTGERDDAGPTLHDPGPARRDAGPIGADAGAFADAGSRPLDAGPSIYDAGSHLLDAGPGSDDAGALRDAGPLADAGANDAGDPDITRTLRVVTLNTHSFQEGAASIAKLWAIGEGLAALSVDVVGLNEVMSGVEEGGETHDAAAIIADALEASSGLAFSRASYGFAHWDTGALMANTILSRWPILESDARSLTTTDFWPAPNEQRNVVYARLDVPEVGLINVFVTHTWGWDSADTVAQIHEVKGFMAEKFVGDEALDLLLGDLNTPSTWPHFQTWLTGGLFHLLDPAVDEPSVLTAPTVVGGEHRIDFVLAGEGWPVSEDPARSTMLRVFDGTTLPVVSDHVGVMAVFRWP